MCGCGSKGAQATAGAQFVIKFNDGTVSTAYVDETSARVALARSGRAGKVLPK